ncbi:MAG: response regulator transcription factor [Alphaproteobacteria bacterium]|nr:response regulator transcription factor [Alphaproteobacteria bacterium]
MRILLIEDNAMLADAIKTGLEQVQYTVEWVEDGESGLAACEANEFNMIILDIMLPRLSGLELLKKLRDSKNATPVLILTARDAPSQKVEGLDLGADDYMIKPFDIDELRARVRALIRRNHGRSNPLLVWEDIELNPASRTVKRNGELVALTAQELKVLILMMEATGRVISKNQLEESIYGWESEVGSNTVEAVIYKLRKKLGRDMIKTVRGIGYIVP